MSKGFVSQYFLFIMLFILTCGTIVLENMEDHIKTIKRMELAHNYLAIEQLVLYDVKHTLIQKQSFHSEYKISDIQYKVEENENHIIITILEPINEILYIMIDEGNKEIIAWQWKREKIE